MSSLSAPFLVAVIGTLVAMCSSSFAAKTPGHVVILMLENRSFDHYLGMLKESNSEIDGCLQDDPRCFNPMDPSDPTSKKVFVDDEAVNVQPADPSHSVPGTTQQIFGGLPDTTDPAPMNGFIINYAKEMRGKKQGGEFIMKCFNQTHVPILATLAKEYLVFDRWHAAVPGPTEVNRAFAYAATSDGMGTNDDTRLAEGLPGKTIFSSLNAEGASWAVYFREFPTTLFQRDMRTVSNLNRHHSLDKFYEDVKKGDLPQFTWLEPRYYELLGMPATDQHPDHDVALGEEMIKDVYEALRASDLWEDTLFMITYDEHGGFFDHVSPPRTVNPDGKNSTNPPFAFDRLGIRVPTVAVSPYISKGKVDHTLLEHSSIPATIREWFAPNQPFLTKRDAQSNTFDGILDLDKPRDDCPKTLPKPVSHREEFPGTYHPLNGKFKISHLQETFARVAAGINGVTNAVIPDTEEDAAEFVAGHINNFFGREVAVLRPEGWSCNAKEDVPVSVNTRKWQ